MPPFDVIALDGPGGVGKSSTARALAQRLGYFFLSSGQIYRALAWSALRSGWRPDQPPDTSRLEAVRIEVQRDGSLRVDGEAPGAELGSDAISEATSRLSALPAVRVLANRVQRETVASLAQAGHFTGVILEGRDIGTVVFPDARHKFFVTADPAVRARRRYDELRRKDPTVTLEGVAQALEARDRRDSERDEAPLKPAADAVHVDTSRQTLEEVVEALARQVRQQP